MAGAAIARILLGLAAKSAKKTGKAVKKPKGAKVAKLSEADDAKAAAYWERRHGKTGKKVVDKVVKAKKKKYTKSELAALKKTAKMPQKTGRKKLIRGAPFSPKTTGRDVALAGAGGAAVTYVGTKEKSPAIKSRVSIKASPKPKKKVVKKKQVMNKATPKTGVYSEFDHTKQQWIKHN